MICPICKVNETQTDSPMCILCRNSNEHYRVGLYLDGLDNTDADFGLVYDCLGSRDYIPEEKNIVGFWSRSSTGIWVSIRPTIEAMQDELILYIKDVNAYEKKKKKSKAKPASGKVRKSKAKKITSVTLASGEIVQLEEEDDIDEEIPEIAPVVVDNRSALFDALR